MCFPDHRRQTSRRPAVLPSVVTQTSHNTVDLSRSLYYPWTCCALHPLYPKLLSVLPYHPRPGSYCVPSSVVHVSLLFLVTTYSYRSRTDTSESLHGSPRLGPFGPQCSESVSWESKDTVVARKEIVHMGSVHSSHPTYPVWKWGVLTSVLFTAQVRSPTGPRQGLDRASRPRTHPPRHWHNGPSVPSAQGVLGSHCSSNPSPRSTSPDGVASDLHTVSVTNHSFPFLGSFRLTRKGCKAVLPLFCKEFSSSKESERAPWNESPGRLRGTLLLFHKSFIHEYHGEVGGKGGGRPRHGTTHRFKTMSNTLSEIFKG